MINVVFNVVQGDDASSFKEDRKTLIGTIVLFLKSLTFCQIDAQLATRTGKFLSWQHHFSSTIYG